MAVLIIPALIVPIAIAFFFAAAHAELSGPSTTAPAPAHE
jgi:hypothetical protein